MCYKSRSGVEISEDDISIGFNVMMTEIYLFYFR